MTAAPDDCHIRTALEAAKRSPCRSKRGVVLFNPTTGAHRGAGYNGPPDGVCPGRAICAGTCGQRSVHAEVRALRDAMRVWIPNYGGSEPGALDLVHVELAADGGVVACDGPSCPGCAAPISDAGFVGGVWLYEMSDWLGVRIPEPNGRSHWRRYTAEEFHHATLERCGLTSPSPPSRLRRAREIAGLSLGQAAAKLGWSQGPLQAMEVNAGYQPTEDDLRTLAALYGVSAAWLRGADPVVPAAAARLLRESRIEPRDRDALEELLGAIYTPERP